MWTKFLTWLGLREQARLAGASAAEANKAAVAAVVLQEVEKKAEAEQKK